MSGRQTRLSCVGVNHKTAPVALREQVAFSAEQLRAALPALQQEDGVDEAVIISTCNRVEVYVAGDVDAAPAAVRRFLHRFHGLEDGALDDHLTHRNEEDALHHLFRVASALDAIVVGEPQILGQVKEAFFHAVGEKTVGPVVTRAFHRAFTTAKRVRTETAIAAAAANVASAGVDLAGSIFGRLNGLCCVLVGAGDMGELAARHFGKAGGRLIVVNRSLEKARKLADEVGGTAQPLDALPRLTGEADVILVSTGAPNFVLTAEMVRAVAKQRRYRPLLVVDISVPRNADPDIATLDDCYLYDVDDLVNVVDENLQKRRAEAAKAETIVAEETQKAKKAGAEKRAVPVIKALREKATQIAAAEARKTLGVLGDGLSEKQQKSVEAMGNAIVNKLLHGPLTTLRAAAAADADQHASELLAAAIELFGIDEAAVTGDEDIRDALRAADDATTASQTSTPAQNSTDDQEAA